MKREDDREVLQHARPFIRSIAAFLLYLRFGTPNESGPAAYDAGRAHDQADGFLDRLDKDLKK